jgi:hypothetical protein
MRWLVDPVARAVSFYGAKMETPVADQVSENRKSAFD